MNPGRFYLSNMRGVMNPMMNTGYLPARGGIGFFGRITNSLRSFNWSGLLNGANKTLNVVNQTIPLVRQAGPMFNNMKSMLRIAKAFGSETNGGNTNYRNKNNNITFNSNSNDNIKVKHSYQNGSLDNKKEVSNNSYPNFFV